MNYSKLGIKITNEQYDERLKSLNLIRIDNYVDTNTTIYHKCKFCDRKFKKKPKEVSKIKCKCLEKRDIYIDKIREKNIALLGGYYSMREKTLHHCLSCDLKFMTTPKSLLNSSIGCPSCSGKKFSTQKYKSLLPNDIITEDVYDGSNKYLNHKCTVCNKTWKTKPNYILHMKCGCPYCSFSKGEKQIYQFLDDIEIRYEKQKTIKINESEYRFDFFLVDLNIFIEYDGIQHFEPVEHFGGEKQFFKTISSDEIKNNWCEENGYQLIRINYMIEDIETFLCSKIYSILEGYL